VAPVFDSQVYENLEIFELKDKENSFGEKGTLYAYLNRCLTASGRRKLRKWLDAPLVDVAAITERQ
jgi:DNA mismatch repair protein MSH6